MIGLQAKVYELIYRGPQILHGRCPFPAMLVADCEILLAVSDQIDIASVCLLHLK